MSNFGGYNLPGFVFNSVGWDLEGMCDGRKYIFKAFSAKVYDVQQGQDFDFIYNITDANHILNQLKPEGLVSLEYGKMAQAVNPNYEEYKQNQIIQGLRNALETYEYRVALQVRAIDEITQSNNKPSIKSQTVLKELEYKVKSIKKWLEDAGKAVEKTINKDYNKIAEMPKDIFSNVSRDDEAKPKPKVKVAEVKNESNVAPSKN